MKNINSFLINPKAEGHRAWWYGLSVSVNPYPAQSLRALLWRNGYNMARKNVVMNPTLIFSSSKYTIMDKDKFIEHLAAKHNKTKAEVSRMFEMFIPEISKQLAAGTSFQFRGHFSLKVQTREGKTGHNFHTNEMIDIPPRRVVKFKPGVNLLKKLKDL